MRKLALATLSFALVFSLCPTASMAAYAEDENQLVVSNTTSRVRSGHIENVTVAADNYLGANFVMPGDYVADAILPDDAIQQIASGKDVDLWLESARGVDDDAAALIQAQLGDYLPITSFKLTSYWQVDGEAPVKGVPRPKTMPWCRLASRFPTRR